jgi:hypothetical protein
MSKRLVNIGFVLVITMVAAQFAWALVTAAPLNQRALNGSENWSMRSATTLQATLGQSAGGTTALVQPGAGGTAAAAASDAEPEKPSLGWLFVAFVIAAVLAVRLTLLANPDEVHARSH